MFFETLKQARSYAQLETIYTGVKHIARKSKKYLCPPATNFGRDYIPGYTVTI